MKNTMANIEKIYEQLKIMKAIVDSLEFNGETLSVPMTGSLIARIDDFNNVDGYLTREVHIYESILSWEV